MLTEASCNKYMGGFKFACIPQPLAAEDTMESALQFHRLWNVTKYVADKFL